jgi:CRP-like cAMP-binding protein
MAGDGFAAGNFLALLHPPDRAALESSGRHRQFPPGALLFSEGDDGHDVYLLVDGLVKVFCTAASGRQVILDVVESGSVLGELSAIDGEPRSASALALTEIRVLVVPVSRFVAFLDNHPAAATSLLRAIAARLRSASRRELEFGTSDALARLCRCLLVMQERYGAGTDRSVSLPLTQQDLASMSGLSREAVVKGLRSLRELGWIEASGRNVTLVDLDAVRGRADA